MNSWQSHYWNHRNDEVINYIKKVNTITSTIKFEVDGDYERLIIYNLNESSEIPVKILQCKQEGSMNPTKEMHAYFSGLLLGLEVMNHE